MRQCRGSSIRTSLPAAVLGCAALLSCPAALAASAEETMSAVTLLMFYGSIAFAVIVITSVFYLRPRDRQLTPLREILKGSAEVYTVTGDATVADCVRRMTARKVGALVVVDGRAVRGIFTERDALVRVLAAGLDPVRVPVSEVMTRDPTLVPPETTVGAAMELVTRRRFRHLPVVEDGRLLAVVSSGDLTRWLVEDTLAGDPGLSGAAH